MLSDLSPWLSGKLTYPVSIIYGRLVALILLYGATVHISNIFGISGQPWNQTPLLWRSLDIILLIFNLLTAIGLWQKWHLAVVSLFVGIMTLQWLPYTLWRSQFILQPGDGQVLNGLIGTEAILLTIFALLLAFKK